MYSGANHLMLGLSIKYGIESCNEAIIAIIRDRLG